MNNKPTISRDEEYRSLENRVTCILQQRWPANEISQWEGILKGKPQAVACAILRHRHIVDSPPIAINRSGAIRTLFISPGNFQ